MYDTEIKPDNSQTLDKTMKKPDGAEEALKILAFENRKVSKTKL